MESKKFTLKAFSLVFLFVYIGFNTFGQTTIWSEDFSTYSDNSGYKGSIVSTSGDYPSSVTKWTLDVSNLSLTASDDWFMVNDVSGNLFEAQDIDGEAIWTSENIDIAGYSNVSISVDISHSNTLEGTDYINLFYKINGGSETAFSTNGSNSDNFSALSSSQTGLSGNSLQIVIKVKNNVGDEAIQFDNVLITGTATVNPPNSFSSAASSSTQIDLSCVDNGSGSGDDIIVAYNTVNTFGTPSGTYNSGDPITGGGTVFYVGDDASLGNHTGLSPNTTYYYKTWSYNASHVYSPGLTDNATTYPNAWINEFHYDNTGTDINEFVEIVIDGAGAYNLSDFTVHLINGSTSSSYDSKTVDLFTQGTTSNGYTLYSYNFSSLQNDDDGIALEYDGILIQFISYEGSITGASGIVNGVTSELIGVSQNAAVVGTSIQLLPSAKGSKSSYSDFVWTTGEAATQGDLNSDGGDGDGSQVLPIELLSFTATQHQGMVILDWTTLNEINNDFFTVERSLDGINFIEIGQVVGAGNSNIEVDYSLTDMATFNTTVYYRLKQTDFDGASTYSSLVSFVNTETEFALSVSISDQQLNLQLNQATKFLIELYDASGRLVFQKQMNQQDLQISTSNWERGVYFLRLQNDKTVINRKLFL